MNTNICKHQGDKTQIVKAAATTVEEVWTICDECKEVLKKEFEV